MSYPHTQNAVTTACNLINGAWEAPGQHPLIENRNPFDARELLGYAPDSSRADAARAIEAARSAFTQWRLVPAPQRGKLVEQAARLLLERKEAIARALTQEEGKTLGESLGEVERAIACITFAAGEGVRLVGRTIPSAGTTGFHYTVREPLGVVGLITPWNFPVSIPAWKIAPALVAGNTAVLKPSPLTPITAEMVVGCFVDAGVPAGVLNLVHGTTDVGLELTQNPCVKAVSFTGSTHVGKAVYQQTAAHTGRCLMEMGGKNPLVVLADADLKLAAKQASLGAFGSTGQRCTATSRIIVEKPVQDEFERLLLEEVAQIVMGDGLASETTMGPCVDMNRQKEILAHISQAHADGAKLLCGGGIPGAPALSHGYFIEATVFNGVTPAMRLFREEVFGPVLAITTADNYDHALALANDCAFGLSSSIFTSNLNSAMRFARDSEVGMVHVNVNTTYSEPHLPFGGTKDSGFGGREAGWESLEFYTEWKTVYMDGLY
ncbi:MAG: aldehyde dehydrogenase family protein [Candidatus Sericytochromatia bacterium]|nr:aldehyde dehydrogenase family protein [Candidatus Sericytochromatia bacterium]